MRGRLLGGFGSVALAVIVLAGCGSEKGNPPPVEPATSPKPAMIPFGITTGLRGEAEGVAVDSEDGLAAVAYRDPDRLEIFNVNTGHTIDSYPTPDPSRHLEIAQDGTTVLVPVEYDDKLIEFPLGIYAGQRRGQDGVLPVGLPEPITTGDFPHDAVEAENGTIFVGDEGGDTVTVIRDGKVTASLDAPEQPGGVATGGNVLAVVSVAAREITFFDTDTLEKLATLDAGAGPSHVVAGDDGRFYVADTGGDAILVYDATPADGGEPELVDRTNVPGSPYGLAIDNTNNRLYVTQTALNRVLQLELTDVAPRVLEYIQTVQQPNSVGVDTRTGRVVVVGRTKGEVQIFDPDDIGAPSS